MYLLIFFLFDRSDFVALGGTADANRWDPDVDPEDGGEILRRCCKLFPSLKVSHLVKFETTLPFNG